MSRLIKLLLISSLLLPFATGTVAVVADFGDPWGMGNNDPVAEFFSAVLPVTSPGFFQFWLWPLTYGVALLLSPLTFLRQQRYYAIALLLYLTVLSGGWLFGWAFAPDLLNGPHAYAHGRLDQQTWKFGLMLLTDAALLAVTVGWWYWRRPVPDRPAAP